MIWNKIKDYLINFFSNKYVRIIIFSILALEFFLFALFSSIKSQTSDIQYYIEYSKKHNIKSYAGVSQEKLEKLYSKLILYAYSGNENLLTDFNERETMHMKDVHKLYQLGEKFKFPTIVLGVILVGCKKNRYKNIKYFTIAMISIVLLSGIIGYIIYLDFDTAFIKFHEIFFDNDLWLLNPETDIMIRMLPQDYFMNVSYKIFKSFSINIVFVLLLSGTYLTVKRRFNKNIE